MKGRRSAGRFGPYYQSQRAEIYRRAADRLVASGHVYRDYSTEKERAAEKAVADREKRAYRFRRKPLTDEEAARFEAEGTSFCPPVPGPAGPDARPPRPDQGGRRVLHRRDRRLRHRPTRRHAPLQLRQRGRRRRDADHPRRPGRRAPLQHVPAAPGLRGPRREAAGLRASPVRGRAGLASPRCPSARSRSTRSRGSWSTCISTSRRAISRRPSSTTSPDWAGASTAPRRSSAATSSSRSSRSTGSPALPPATTRINCSGSRGSG